MRILLKNLWLPTTKLLLLCTKPGVSPIPSVLRGRRSWENSAITTYKSTSALTLISVSIVKYDQHPLIQTSSRLRLISKSKWPGLPLLEVPQEFLYSKSKWPVPNIPDRLLLSLNSSAASPMSQGNGPTCCCDECNKMFFFVLIIF